MILGIITGFAFFVTAIVFHELGHFIVAYRNNLSPQIIFTGKKLFTEFESTLSVDTNKQIYIFGVLFGFLPLFIGIYINTYTLSFLPLYLLGILGDIKRIEELNK